MADIRGALGQVLGPAYRVEREVRPVGDCRMFVALDQATGAELLVKVLPTSLSLGVDESRFATNLLALGDRLTHPGLVVLEKMHGARTVMTAAPARDAVSTVRIGGIHRDLLALGAIAAEHDRPLRVLDHRRHRADVGPQLFRCRPMPGIAAQRRHEDLGERTHLGIRDERAHGERSAVVRDVRRAVDVAWIHDERIAVQVELRALVPSLVDRINQAQKESGELKALDERDHRGVRYFRRLERTFDGHTKGVTGLAFAHDGRHFASSSQDGTVRIWGLPALAP